MKKLLMIIAAMSLMAGVAAADILWDQSLTRSDLLGFWNSNSPGGFGGGGEIYGASDITLGNPAVITKVTTYYTNLGYWAPGVYNAKFAVYPKTGPLPVNGVDNPQLGADVSVTITDIGNSVFEVVADGLNENLAAGDYWILLTPTAPQGFVGVPEFQIFYDGGVIGDPSAQIGYGGFFTPEWLVNGESLDGAILVEGQMVVADEVDSWGSVKSLYR